MAAWASYLAAKFVQRVDRAPISYGPRHPPLALRRLKPHAWSGHPRSSRLPDGHATQRSYARQPPQNRFSTAARPATFTRYVKPHLELMDATPGRPSRDVSFCLQNGSTRWLRSVWDARYSVGIAGATSITASTAKAPCPSGIAGTPHFGHELRPMALGMVRTISLRFCFSVI